MTTAIEVVEQDLDYIVKGLQSELDQLSGHNLLILGGAGFLGYYLVQSVLHWNKTVPPVHRVHVTVYDNYIRGVPPWLSNLKGDSCLTLVKHDVTAPISPLNSFSYIIHAASIASPTYYRNHPIETMDANVIGLRNALEYCRRQSETSRPVKGLLFLSSSEIYGDPAPEEIPTREIYRGYVSCTGPRACYDEAKRFCETLCVNFARHCGVPVRVARPFNNYGPGLKISDRRVLSDFARDVFNGRDIAILSDGTATRTFCYSADAIIGYYKVMLRGHNGEAYNIGSQAPEISIHDAATLIRDISTELYDYKGNVLLKKSTDPDYLADNPRRRCPDISKAHNDLAFNPTIELKDGLRRLLIWYSDNREAEAR